MDQHYKNSEEQFLSVKKLRDSSSSKTQKLEIPCMECRKPELLNNFHLNVPSPGISHIRTLFTDREV